MRPRGDSPKVLGTPSMSRHQEGEGCPCLHAGQVFSLHEFFQPCLEEPVLLSICSSVREGGVPSALQASLLPGVCLPASYPPKKEGEAAPILVR